MPVGAETVEEDEKGDLKEEVAERGRRWWIPERIRASFEVRQLGMLATPALYSSGP